MAFKKILFIIVTFLGAIAFTSCNENIIDDTSENTVVTENSITEVSVAVTFDGAPISNDNYTINSIVDDRQLIGDCEQLKSVYNDLPQLYYITDADGKIIMLSRACVNLTKDIYVNEETTAIALASLNPLFVNISSDDFGKIVNIIQSTPAYGEFYDEVKKAIKNRVDLFDPNNTDLFVKLNNVWDDICKSTEYESHTRNTIFTRASVVTGIKDPDPVLVQSEGVNVILRNKGLVPTYECQVLHGGRIIHSELLESHSSYGFMDLFSTESDFCYGDPLTFNLSEIGEYEFYLDRTTERAVEDFSRRLWADCLSMIGLYNCGELLNLSAAVVGTLSPLIVNPNTTPGDVFKAIGGLVINTAMGLKWPQISGVLTRLAVVYNALKGFSNEMARSILGFSSPYKIDFCLCSYDNSISSCTKSELEKVSGDDQEGFSNQKLLLPLVVSTKVFAENGSEIDRSTYQKVKFEVVSGGGYVDREFVGTEAGSKKASTYWTIGEHGEQKVKAVVVDMVTGVEISEPVFFTARLRENADLTIRLDWNKLSGNTDIDLHVTDPYGEEIAYYNMTSSSGGWLDRDDVVGPGPEHICWTTAPIGTYLIQVHYYGSETRAVTNYTVTIRANGKDYGPFTSSIGYDQLVTIGVLNLPDGTFTRSSSEPTFVEQFKIEKHKAFPPKNKKLNL